MLCILAVYGIKVAELDGLHGFAAAENLPGAGVPTRKMQEQSLERLLDLADLFHARHLQVFGTSHTDKLEDDAVEKFRGICDQASKRCLKISLEPRTNTNIASIQTAAMIASQAQRRNVGISINAWPHFRAKRAATDLLAIPVDHISTIRLSHALTARETQYFTSSPTQDRRGPEEESSNLIRFLKTIIQHGVSAPLSEDVTSYHPRHTNPFALCAFLEDETSHIWNQALRA